MKMSRKIIIPALSTAIGISLAAGVGGAFAWYQYNSQATASFLGSSVADTGVLQIGYMDANNQIKWGRDYYENDGVAKNLAPVTFGALNQDGTLKDTAYAYPEAGCGETYQNWVADTEGKYYSQFEIYFRAYQSDATEESGYKQVERNVFLSNFVFNCVDTNGDVDSTKVASDALRVHIAVENGGNYLLSKTAHEGQTALNLFGEMDLDKNGEFDTFHKTAFGEDYNPNGKDLGDPIVYGIDTETQETQAIADLKQERDTTTGKMPATGETGFDKKLFTTSKNSNVKVTVTIWLEGWELLKKDVQGNKSNLWNPNFAAGTNVQVGLEFDSGKFREDDLTVEQQQNNNNNDPDPTNDPGNQQNP